MTTGATPSLAAPASDDMDAGVDLLCERLAAAGESWGDADLVRTFFNRDSETPGFETVRDQVLPDLKDAISGLRGAGAGLAVGSDSPPVEWLQSVGLLESLMAGFEGPHGSVEEIQAIRDAFGDVATTLDGGPQLAAACRALAGFCDTLAGQEQAALVRFGWSVLFVIGTSVTMRALAAFTTAVAKAGVLSMARAATVIC
jgi:hypothetical protein